MAFSDSIKLTMSSSEEIGKAIQKQRRGTERSRKRSLHSGLVNQNVLSRNMNLVKYY